MVAMTTGLTAKDWIALMPAMEALLMLLTGACMSLRRARSWGFLLTALGLAFNVSFTVLQSMEFATTSDVESLAMITPRDRPTFRLDRETSLPFSILYNAFVPQDQGQEGIDNALEIVEEQIGYIGQSSASNYHGSNKKLTVFYNTLGLPNALNATFMDDLCSVRNNLTCRHLRHYVNGSEELTLQNVYEYCHEYPSHKVIYLHTKGSYHDRPSQRHWRNNMIQAVLHPDCLNPPDNSCNACGFMFWPVWTMMFPGNFFTADCGYVRKLVPPEDFLDKAEAFIQERDREGSFFTTSLFMDRLKTVLGKGRYAFEHWIASHPSLRPCDVGHSRGTEYKRLTSHGGWYNFSMAPRYALQQASSDWNHLNMTLFRRFQKDQTARLREFFLLGGNILKWMTLYGEVPPKAAWVWEWYPDGELWRKAFEMYGNRTFQVMNTLVELNRTKAIKSLTRT